MNDGVWSAREIGDPMVDLFSGRSILPSSKRYKPDPFRPTVFVPPVGYTRRVVLPLSAVVLQEIIAKSHPRQQQHAYNVKLEEIRGIV